MIIGGLYKTHLKLLEMALRLARCCHCGTPCMNGIRIMLPPWPGKAGLNKGLAKQNIKGVHMAGLTKEPKQQTVNNMVFYKICSCYKSKTNNMTYLWWLPTETSSSLGLWRSKSVRRAFMADILRRSFKEFKLLQGRGLPIRTIH